MTPTAAYTDIYYIVIMMFFILTVIFRTYLIENKRSVGLNNILLVVILAITAFYYGLRPFDVGTDTGTYVRAFEESRTYASYYAYISNRKGDFLFYNMIYLWSKIGGPTLFLLSISLLTSLFWYRYIRLLTKKSTVVSSSLIVLYYVSMHFFFQLYCNIIRNGIAIPCILIFSYYLCNKRYRRAIIWGTIAALFHLSSLIPILFLLAVVLFKKIGLIWYYIIYVVVGAMSIARIGIQNILPLLGINRLEIYLVLETDYKVGFRPDFFIFNTLFLGLFIFLRDKETLIYDIYLKLYILTSCLFFMWFHIPYSDRVGLYSWILIPILASIGTSNYSVRYRAIMLQVIFLMLFCIGLILK